MQNTATGQMVDITDLTEQQINDKIPRRYQGAIFRIGEEVRVKGGFFAVHSIGREMMVLRSLPGTRKPQLVLKTAHQSAVECVMGIVSQLEKLPPYAQRALRLQSDSTLESVIAQALSIVVAFTEPEKPDSSAEPTGTVVTIGEAH
jgi:hypothetical protein